MKTPVYENSSFSPGPKGIIRYMPKLKLIHVTELIFRFCHGHKTVAIIYHINFATFILYKQVAH